MKNIVLWRRRIMLAVIAVLVAWGLFEGFRPQPVEVDMGEAVRAPLRVTVEQEGRTRVVDRYVITSPVNGYARRISLDAGDAVERGATVAELEPMRAEVLDVRRRAEAVARVASAEAGLNAAQQRADAAASNASLAQKELQRARAEPEGVCVRGGRRPSRQRSRTQRGGTPLRAVRRLRRST